MDLVQVPPKSHGSFYEGDCYVLLSVSAPRAAATPAGGAGSLTPKPPTCWDSLQVLVVELAPKGDAWCWE